MTTEPRDLFAGAPADDEALARYLAGESPADEADAVRRWLAQQPERAQAVARLQRALQSFAAAPPPVDVERALQHVRTRMAEAEPRVLPLRPRSPAPAGARRQPWGQSSAQPWARRALRIAAAVVLLAGGALFTWRATRPAGPAGVTAVAAQTFATGVGERDSLWLADGSFVLLGPGSRLRVAAGYGAARREVELAGEAYFEVAPDAARPFVVRSGAATIRDLGTAFAVRQDAGGAVRVAVTEGTVELSAAAAQAGAVVLQAGDRGVLPPDGRAAVAQRAAALDDDLAWTRGELVFVDAPLERVAAELRRWYGVELRVDDPALTGRHLTASFAGEPAPQVLRVIALALGAELQMRGDTAVLRRTEERP